MSTILDRIIADKIKEVQLRKEQRSIADLESAPHMSRSTLSLRDSLLQSDSGIIAEFKRRSPSKGWIHQNADVLTITSGYSAAGASGISILTDTPYFGGTPDDLTSARGQVACPILRKDFMIDEYQVLEARAMGADVILLIAAALTVEQTKALACRARELDLEVLLEVHNRAELGHVNEFVQVVGVNNRNLKTFEVDVELSMQLLEHIPDDFVKISESGISSPETVRMLRQAGYRGFLMGENFMKEQDPAAALKHFIAQCR